MIKVTLDEFNVLSKYIYEISGITLDSSKVYLIETRLGSLVEEYGCDSYSEFYYKAKSDTSKAIEKRVLNAITTRETLWFRDQSPFEALQHKIIPDLIDRRMKENRPGRIPIKIWSAASSTGQEIYSIAMTIRDLLPDMSKFDVSILGTDISDAAIAGASYGKYTQFEMDRGMPAAKLHKYFTKEGDSWKIKDELRCMATFRKFNLFDDYRTLGKFDIVFCRNVAIYFSLPDRKSIFNRIADVLNPEGTLLIGSSEYLAGICDRFESQRHCRAVFYKLKSANLTAGFAGAPAATATAAPRMVTPMTKSTVPAPAAPPASTVRPAATTRPTTTSPTLQPAATTKPITPTLRPAVRPVSTTRPATARPLSTTKPVTPPTTKAAIPPKPSTEKNTVSRTVVTSAPSRF